MAAKFAKQRQQAAAAAKKRSLALFSLRPDKREKARHKAMRFSRCCRARARARAQIAIVRSFASESARLAARNVGSGDFSASTFDVKPIYSK